LVSGYGDQPSLEHPGLNFCRDIQGDTKTSVRKVPNISQDTVMTCLICADVLNGDHIGDFITNLLLNLTVKEFWRSFIRHLMKLRL